MKSEPTNLIAAAVPHSFAMTEADVTRIDIYTDGATYGSNPGPAGWGFVALLLNEAGDLVGTTERKGSSRAISTNNRAEMAAALNALTFTAEQQASGAWPTCPVTIISDSRNLVKGMAEWMPGWLARGWRKGNNEQVANKDLWERLNEASEGMTVGWYWVAGHSDIRWNERADALASEGAKVAARRL